MGSCSNQYPTLKAILNIFQALPNSKAQENLGCPGPQLGLLRQGSWVIPELLCSENSNTIGEMAFTGQTGEVGIRQVISEKKKINA
jgi:hypothetical protein